MPPGPGLFDVDVSPFRIGREKFIILLGEGALPEVAHAGVACTVGLRDVSYGSSHSFLLSFSCSYEAGSPRDEGVVPPFARLVHN